MARVELRDLPSVDELAKASDDPLAVDAAREVLADARVEIRAGGSTPATSPPGYATA